MTTAELATTLTFTVPREGVPPVIHNPEAAAFAVARTVQLARGLQPDLIIPLIQDDAGRFGRQVALGAPTSEPLILRRNSEGVLALSKGVLDIVSQAERVLFVGEVLHSGKEVSEFLTLFALGERTVGVAVLWDKRELLWPRIGGVPVHAIFRGQSPEERPAITRAQAMREWMSSKMPAISSGISWLASARKL